MIELVLALNIVVKMIYNALIALYDTKLRHGRIPLALLENQTVF
jgi:hypothetical protein